MLSSRHLFTLALTGGMAVATSAQAQSQSTQAQSQAIGGLEEITVTAERVTTNLQETPVSVLQVTGEQMYNLGVENVAELAKFMPNVSIGPSGQGGQPNFSIRGVSQIRTGISGDRSVGFYVDGQYFPRTTGSLMQALDIANVEVLRGPQGTLFGRNNTGGAISITTQKPTQDLDGHIRIGLGDFNRRDLNGVANIPITDNIAFRGSVATYNRDGYVEGANGQTRGNVDDLLWRTAFRFDLTDNATLDLAYTDVNAKKTGFPTNSQGHVNPDDLSVLACQVSGACPMNPNQFVQFGPGLDWVGVPMNMDTPYKDSLKITGDPFAYVGGTPEHNNEHTRFVNATVDWKFANHLTLKSITGGMKITTDQLSDSDGTPWDVGTSGSGLDHKSWSEELQIIGDGYFDDRVNFLAGVYRFGEKNRESSWSQSYGSMRLGGAGQQPWQVTQPLGETSGSFALRPGQTNLPYYVANIPSFVLPFLPPLPPPFSSNPADYPIFLPKNFPYSMFAGGQLGGFFYGLCPRVYPFVPGTAGNPQPVAGSTELMGCIDTGNLGLQPIVRSADDSSTDSKAIYGDVTVHITDKLSMSAGLRYTEDTKSWLVEGASATGGQLISAQDGDWHSTDWRFVTQYQWTPELMTYFNVSKAYKAGGLTDTVPFGFGGFGFGEPKKFADQCPHPAPPDKDPALQGQQNVIDQLTGECVRNPLTGYAVNSPYIPYDPETVINYEFGFRSEWFDSRLRANVTVFHMDYDDKQQEVIILPGQNGGNTEYANSYGGGPLIVNASQVVIDGLETELSLAATDHLTLNLAYSRLNARYKELSQLLIDSGSLTLDTPLPRAPKYNYTFQIHYGHEVFGGFGSAQIAYAVNGKQYSGASKNTQWVIPALGLVNARVSYMSGDRTWSTGLYVRNLTDKFYLNGGFSTSSFGGGSRDFLTGGADIIFPGQPREIGLDFTYNFGN